MSGRRSRTRPNDPAAFDILDDLEGNKFASWVSAQSGLKAPHHNVDAPFSFAEAHAPGSIPPWLPLEPAKRFRTNKPLSPVDHEGHGRTFGVESDLGGLHKRAILALRRPVEPLQIDDLFSNSHQMKDFRRLWLVSLFLGYFGVDRFITGRYITGTLKLLTLGGLGLWWASDLFSIACGTAVDRGGHPFAGKRPHRLAAITASVLAVGVLTGAVAPQVAPYVESLKRETVRALTPPPPAPEWTAALPGSEGTGNGQTAELTVTGKHLRILAESEGLAYFHLQPVGGTIKGTMPAISLETASTKSVILDVEPGTYTVVVLAPSAKWKVMAEDLAPKR